MSQPKAARLTGGRHHIMPDEPDVGLSAERRKGVHRKTTLLRSCNWDSFFLVSQVQIETDKIYSILYKFLDSIKPAQT